MNIKSSVWSRLRHSGSLSYISDNYIKVLPNIPYVKLLLHLIPDPTIADEHLPSITLKKQQGWWSVWVEGSMSKFLYGTNVFELDEEDKKALVLKIYFFLRHQSLAVEIKDISHAVLHKLDVSKILLALPTVSLPKILEYQRKFDFDIRNEILTREYKSIREGGKGRSVTFGTTKKKFLSIYDKLEEVSNNSKKSQIEKEFLTFYDNNTGHTYQLLKYEESLFDKTRLDKVCNTLTGQSKKYYTFADLWDKELIRKILLYHGKPLFHSPDIKILLLGNRTPSEIQRILKTNFPTMRASRMAQIAHWTGLAYELGLKETKKTLKKDYSRSSQYRILKDTRIAIEKIENLPMQDVFDDFYNQLQELKPIRSLNNLLLPSSTKDVH